jgi:cytochrome c oxidase subunit IV
MMTNKYEKRQKQMFNIINKCYMRIQLILIFLFSVKSQLIRVQYVFMLNERVEIIFGIHNVLLVYNAKNFLLI